MDTINNVLCWELEVGTEKTVTRLFVVDRFVGSQTMNSKRSPWQIHDMGTPAAASTFAVNKVREWEAADGGAEITVTPGTVGIYESELAGLVPGKTIPPSLRVRIRQRIRRYGR